MLPMSILYPVLALVTLTGLVLLLIPITRFRAGSRREIKVDDFKYGESANVPAYVSIPNRNYMNLLEAPVLFYVACIVLFVTVGVSPVAVTLAWVYVALRLVHTLIHLSYNRVFHRLIVFALSNGVLVVLWVVVGSHVLAFAGK
jgi:hypothetical protein